MSPLGIALLILIVSAIVGGGVAGQVPVAGISFAVAGVLFVVLLCLLAAGRV